MAYPILAPNSTWFAPNVSTVTRSIITEIEIMDSYTPDSSVTVVDSWDASAAKNGSITSYVIGTKLIIAGNGSGKIGLSESAKNTFYNSSDTFSNVVSIINTNLFDFSHTKDANSFFYKCSKLTNVDVSQWDISNITDLAMMFYNCSSLETIDVSNWNVSNVEKIYSMFQYCNKLKNLDLSQWTFTKPMGFRQMFLDCTELTSVGDLSNWNIECYHMENMFKNCSKLQNINLGKIILNPSNTNAGQCVFRGCSSLTSFCIKNFIINASCSFGDFFCDCSKLSNITDLYNVDMNNVTDMSFMFYNCSSLKEIDVSNWNTSKLTNIDHFAAHANLKRKGMEKWNTSSLTNANAAFHNCAEEELDLSGWDVSKVQFFCQMFENSPNLKRVRGLDKWDTSAGLGFDGMFERCGKLEEVDLSAFDTSKAKNNVKASENNHKTATLSNMFLSCNNLKKVKIGSKFAINGDGTNTTAANKLILPTPSIEGADGNWYDVSGDAYAPNAIQDRTEETYYASYPLVADLNVVVKNGSLIDTARAIREKNGTTNKYEPSEFGDAIRAI